MNDRFDGKRFTSLLLAALLGIATTLSLSACDTEDGPAENAGEQIDEAADEAQDAVEEAGEEAEEAVDELQE